MRVVVTGGGAIGRHLAHDLAERGHDVTLVEQDGDLREAREVGPGHADRLGDACEPWVLEEADVLAGRRRGRRDRRRRGQPRHVAAREAGVRRPAGARPREPPEERVALHRAVGRGSGGLAAARPDGDGRGGRHGRGPRPAAPARGREGLDRRDAAARALPERRPGPLRAPPAHGHGDRRDPARRTRHGPAARDGARRRRRDRGALSVDPRRRSATPSWARAAGAPGRARREPRSAPPRTR